ncbi:hypothetical protein cypCar_00025214 [Cyprinus carpio]|nr:hypothetical protein cypCar_00025214 [Cyprinus carpio]
MYHSRLITALETNPPVSRVEWDVMNGAEVTEPNISDTRGERMDLLVKQEEAAAGDGAFLSGERDEAVAQERAGSVANLRAALMSKNSLLSLGAEMLGEENPLLFDYLPKGGHSLSRVHTSIQTCDQKYTSVDVHVCIFLQEEMQEEDNSPNNNAGLERVQVPVEEDQMVKEKHGVCVAEVQGGGPGWRQELACSLCKQLFSSLLQLRQHEYSHTLSLMALSLDCLDHHRPLVAPSLLNPPSARYHCSQCPASFTLKSNADRHEKTIHLKRKLMQCMYCLKHFRDRTDLNRHLSSVHSSERVYMCPACSRTFSTQKNLASHGKVCCQSGISPTEQLWNLHGLNEEDHGHIHIDD